MLSARFCPARPIVPVGADGPDPQVRLAIAGQHLQPALKPILRGDGPGRIDVGRLVVKHGDEMVRVRAEIFQVQRVELIAHRHHDPELLVHRVQRIGHLDEERRDLFLVGRVEFLPVDDHAARLRAFQLREKIDDELVAPVFRPHGQAFHRLRLPDVVHHVGQHRHQHQPLGGRQPLHAHVIVRAQRAEAVGQGEPVRADMREQVRVRFQRAVGIRVPIRVKPSRTSENLSGFGCTISRSLAIRSCPADRLRVELQPRWAAAAEAAGLAAAFCCCMALSWPFSFRTEAGSCSCGRTKSACTKSTTAQKNQDADEQEHPPQPGPAPPLRVHEDERLRVLVAGIEVHRGKRKKPSAFSVVRAAISSSGTPRSAAIRSATSRV